MGFGGPNPFISRLRKLRLSDWFFLNHTNYWFQCLATHTLPCKVTPGCSGFACRLSGIQFPFKDRTLFLNPPKLCKQESRNEQATPSSSLAKATVLCFVTAHSGSCIPASRCLPAWQERQPIWLSPPPPLPGKGEVIFIPERQTCCQL
jgi:hypothetical protein